MLAASLMMMYQVLTAPRSTIVHDETRDASKSEQTGIEKKNSWVHDVMVRASSSSSKEEEEDLEMELLSSNDEIGSST